MTEGADGGNGRRGGAAEGGFGVRGLIGRLADGDEALDFFLELDLAKIARRQADDLRLVAFLCNGEDWRGLAGRGEDAGALVDFEALGDIAPLHVDLEGAADFDAVPADGGFPDDGDGGAGFEAGDDRRLGIGLDKNGGVGRERVGAEGRGGEQESAEGGINFHREWKGSSRGNGRPGRRRGIGSLS